MQVKLQLLLNLIWAGGGGELNSVNPLYLEEIRMKFRLWHFYQKRLIFLNFCLIFLKIDMIFSLF